MRPFLLHWLVLQLVRIWPTDSHSHYMWVVYNQQGEREKRVLHRRRKRPRVMEYFEAAPPPAEPSPAPAPTPPPPPEPTTPQQNEEGNETEEEDTRIITSSGEIETTHAVGRSMYNRQLIGSPNLQAMENERIPAVALSKKKRMMHRIIPTHTKYRSTTSNYRTIGGSTPNYGSL